MALRIGTRPRQNDSPLGRRHFATENEQCGAIQSAWEQEIILALAGPPSLTPIQAADHFNLEEGLPTAIEDAYPIAFRGREVQLGMRYDRTDGNEDRFAHQSNESRSASHQTGRPKISVPFYLGSADRTDSGNVGVEALYNFNTEGLVLPAFALAARADFPTGRDAAGVDTTIKGIVTKSISQNGPGPSAPQRRLETQRRRALRAAR